MLDDTWYQGIHRRLLESDPVAPAELVEAILDWLVEGLSFRFPNLPDRDMLIDAASDALIGYIKRPEQFDPSKRGLPGFLLMSADGDLRNALAKTRRRGEKETPLAVVELSEYGGNDKGRTEDPGARIDMERLHKKIDALFKDPKDKRIVELIMDGERSTEPFSQVLGLESLPVEEQRAKVKRHKDRIKKRLRRHSEGFRDYE